MKVIHIGLGKTGTTSLQRNVFPMLVEFGIVSSFNEPDFARCLSQFIHRLIEPSELADCLRGHENILLSMETLVEWDPSLWSDACRRSLEAFGPDAVILLTIREPASYLRSLYQQKVHAGNVVQPERFFMDEAHYSRVVHMLRLGELDAINVDAFRLRELIDLYRTHFRRVLVVSTAGVSKLTFLQALYDITDAQMARIVKAQRVEQRQNVSFSAPAMWLTLKREKILNVLGLKTLGSNDRCVERNLNLATVEGKYLYAWSKLDLAEKLRQAPIRLFRQVFAFTRWHAIMTGIVDPVVGRTAYKLPKGIPLGVHLSENQRYYEEVERSYGGFIDYCFEKVPMVAHDKW